MNDLPPALRRYLWVVYLSTALYLGYSVARFLAPSGTWHAGSTAFQHTHILYVIAFIALAYLGERTTLRVTPTISHSLSTSVHVAVIIIFVAPVPVWITLLAVLLAQTSHGDKPLYKRAFNVCHPTLAVAMTNTLCRFVGAPTALLHPGRYAASLPMLLLLVILYYLFDVIILLAVLSLLQRRPFWQVWWDTYRITVLPELAATTIGILGAITWLFDPLALMLVVLPVVIVRLAFRAISQAEDREAALRRRGEQLEAVLKAGEHLRLQSTQAALLHRMASAAQVLAEATAVTGYLRDLGDPKQLERLVQIPGDGDDQSPKWPMRCARTYGSATYRPDTVGMSSR